MKLSTPASNPGRSRTILVPICRCPAPAIAGAGSRQSGGSVSLELPAVIPSAVGVATKDYALKDSGPLAEMRVTDETGWALLLSSHVPLAFRGRTNVSTPLNVPEPVIPW